MSRPARRPSPCRTSRSSPSLDLAGHFDSRLLVIAGTQHGEWPGVLDTDAPGTECFREIELTPPDDPRKAEALEEIRVFEVICP